eukprot:COSAG05_NODE_1003_length_6237_cov_7.337732_1_plen_105_part_00
MRLNFLCVWSIHVIVGLIHLVLMYITYVYYYCNYLFVYYGCVAQHPNEPVPLHIRNAPTALMKGHGYGEGYVYPPDHGHAVKPQSYLPPSLAGSRFWPTTPNKT